ncbi:MAG: hypothetical protein WB974_15080 [Acidobacteriaceae bacterium]
MTPGDYPHGCCPLLRYAAEAETLLAAGLSFGARFGSTDAPEAIMIGRLRQKYGCPGPDYSLSCPWHQFGATGIVADSDVPRVGPKRDDGRPDPGAML